MSYNHYLLKKENFNLFIMMDELEDNDCRCCLNGSYMHTIKDQDRKMRGGKRQGQRRNFFVV